MEDVVESERLSRICAELEITPDVARKFIVDYLALLDLRLERIDRGLDTQDCGQNTSAQNMSGQTSGGSTDPTNGRARISAGDDCVVALLSLDASSSMLGAHEVALVARRLRIELQLGRSASIGHYREDLHRAVERARAQMMAIQTPKED